MSITSRDSAHTGNGLFSLIRMIGRRLSRPRAPALLGDLDERLLSDIGFARGDIGMSHIGRFLSRSFGSYGRWVNQCRPRKLPSTGSW